MIVTLTPNPSIDRTYALDALHDGEVHRSTADWVEAGGKGVNIARVLHANGVPVLPVLPVGGPTGDSVVQLLAEDGIRAVAVPVAGDLRCNVTLTEPDGAVTKINAAGPRLDEAELDALVAHTVATVEHECRAQPDDRPVWFVGCGSLTPGAPDDLFARIISRIREAVVDAADRRAATRHVGVAVDTSGTALARALVVAPDVIKPNLSELEELCARPLLTFGEVVDAARELTAGGVGTVVVSLGQDGALAVTADHVVHGEAPPLEVRTTVGAGDAMLAGFLSHAHLGTSEALRVAVAYGSAAVQRQIGATIGPDAIDVSSVVLTEEFDPSRPSRRSRQAPTHRQGATPAASLGGRGNQGE